jgi:hypothetical protein
MYCLPDPVCFKDCAAGFYESRACSPPNVRQQCTACTVCAAGYYIGSPCTAKSDTVCVKCVAAFCNSEGYNAQFGSPGGCTGKELADTAVCSNNTESYGQACATNTYAGQSRIRMPESWGSSLTATQIMSFDVAPNRSVYAYAVGNEIRTFDYAGIQTGMLDRATLVDSSIIIDICFTWDGSSIFAVVQSSDYIYHCSPACPAGDYTSGVCNSGTNGKWGDGITNIVCKVRVTIICCIAVWLLCV